MPRPATQRAELGCFSSHYSLWQELLAGGADQVIVLEDDVLVDWVYLRRVAEHDFSTNGIQYLRLASTATPPSIYKGELLGRYLVHFLGYALGAQAYLLTRTGAEHLVERMRCVRAPVDDMLDQSWRGSLPNFGLYQHPVISAEGPSHIGAARNAAVRHAGTAEVAAPLAPRRGETALTQLPARHAAWIRPAGAGRRIPLDLTPAPRFPRVFS